MRSIKTTFILYLSVILTAHAQHFEWASTGGNLYAGFQAAVVDQSGNLVVAGVVPVPNFMNGKDSHIYASNGDSVKINLYENPIVIVSYSPEGKINWMRRIEGGRGVPEVNGLAASPDNKIYLLGNSTGTPYFPELRIGLGYLHHHSNKITFLYCLKTDGAPQWVKQDTLDLISWPSSFCIMPNGNFLVSGSMSHDINAGKVSLTAGAGGADYMVSFDKNFQPVWGQNIQYKRNSCCSMGSPVTDIAANGDIYIAGHYLTGAVFNGETHMAPIVDSVTKFNEPYEAYLASYSSEGDFKWVKTSGGKSVIKAIKVSDRGVIIGGYIKKNGSYFGKEVDTSGAKAAVLASFDREGNIQWANTSNAMLVNSIAIDHDNNIYCSLQSKRYFKPFLVVGTDTVEKSADRLIIASYTADGKYRWIKPSQLFMNHNELPVIVPDACGNIYVAGEMFYTLHVKTAWFDAAFIKGDAYGDAPFAVKLKNTYSKRGEENTCSISPGPWKLSNYPNPFVTSTEFVYTTTFDDDNGSLEIYDMDGRMIKSIFSNKHISKGTAQVSFNAGTLPPAVYIAVLKGTSGMASTQFIVSK
ncbi:MAG TPA: T9SS type A sorting domain-containing protein [Bacteroidia bacterium]|jgi:hypothetical protein|nr:T9SS type A sorting domain-containing protein [Bacteroidia bacterium]